MSEPLEIPESTWGDHGHAAIKALLTSFPGVGGVLAELFNHVFVAPLTRRKNEVLVQLINIVKELEDHHISQEDLASDENFISACSHAIQIAVRTHQHEKLEALRNALKNIAIRKDEDEDLQFIFLRLIDELTPLHIRMLDFQQNPDRYRDLIREQEGGTRTLTEYRMNEEVWNAVHPEYRSDSALVSIVTQELYVRRLTFNADLRALRSKMTSKLGDDFLSYITEPNYERTQRRTS